MKAKPFAASAVALSLMLALGGCVGENSNDDGEEKVLQSAVQLFSDASDVALSEACQSMIGQSSEDGLTSVVDFQVDYESKVIRATFESYADDALQACLGAEELCRGFSLEVAQHSLFDAQEAGDDDLSEAWSDVFDSEGHSESIGALYAAYDVIAVISSSSGMPRIDGVRDAGIDSSFNWQ